MSDTLHRPMLQIINGHEGPVLFKVAAKHSPAENRKDLRVQQFRSNRRVGLNQVGDGQAERRPQKILDRDGRIDNVSSHPISMSRSARSS